MIGGDSIRVHLVGKLSSNFLKIWQTQPFPSENCLDTFFGKKNPYIFPEAMYFPTKYAVETHLTLIIIFTFSNKIRTFIKIIIIIVN